MLEQNKDTGSIVVAEVKPESNAERASVRVVSTMQRMSPAGCTSCVNTRLALDGNICHTFLQGDQLIATSGVTYSKTADYNGASVKMGQEVVRLQVQGEVRHPAAANGQATAATMPMQQPYTARRSRPQQLPIA